MISDYLDKTERLMCIKAGALAFAGMSDSESDSTGTTVKTAGGIADSANAAKSIALLAALGTGIPLGVFGHIMGRRISGKRLREEELKEKIKLYQVAADEMASGLSGGSI